MSKYTPLWMFLQQDGGDQIQFSFERIKAILGFDLDHSFLTFKSEASKFGHSVEKISIKEQWVQFCKNK